MSAWIFSPDDKNFKEFMTPNFPKPMFLAHFHPGLVAAFMFGSYKNGTWPCDRPNLDPGTAMLRNLITETFTAGLGRQQENCCQGQTDEAILTEIIAAVDV